MRTNACACIIVVTGSGIIDSHAVTNISNSVAAFNPVVVKTIVTGASAHAALLGVGIDFMEVRTHRMSAEAVSFFNQNTTHRTTKDKVLSDGTSKELR